MILTSAQLNDDYYECLTPETTIQLLEVRYSMLCYMCDIKVFNAMSYHVMSNTAILLHVTICHVMPSHISTYHAYHDFRCITCYM